MTEGTCFKRSNEVWIENNTFLLPTLKETKKINDLL